MSDQSDPTRGGPPPIPVPPLAPPPGAFDDPPTELVDLAGPGDRDGRARGGPGRFALLGLGGLMFAGGTAFALTAAGSGGPETPEAAATALFDAIADEDVLGVLGALDPAERDAVRDPMQQMVNELERLEVLDESFDLSNVSGFDLEFDGLTFEVEQVRPDLARVHLTAGEASVTVNGDEIAVGEFVDDLLAEFDADLSGLSAAETTELDPSDAGGFFVARDTGDGWRISLGYTAAEAARDALGGEVPVPGGGIAPRGADSPEAAVDEMMRAAAEFDFERVIAGFSSEMHPLREYADLYLDDLRIAEGQASDEVSVDVRSIDLEADRSGSTALVQVRGFAISVDADGSRFDMAVDGDCVTLSGDLDGLGLERSPFESGRVCLSELGELSRDGFEELELELAEEGIELPEFGPFNEVEVGIVVVEEDGRWFVSPVRTSLDLGVKGLQALNREHLDGVVDLAEALVDSWASTFSTGFDDELVLDDDPFTTDELDEFEESDEQEELDPVDELEPTEGFDDEFEFDLEFPETFDEQIEFLFGAEAPCILAEVDLLEPELQAAIEQDLLGDGGGVTFEAGEALAGVLERCGAFGP